MAYNPTDWQNLPDTTTPITKNRLNNIETGIKTLDNDIGISDYDNTATYEIGDYCRYNNQIYKCNTTISTAEDWTVAHWTETSIVEEIYNCADFINNLLKRTVLYEDTTGNGVTGQNSINLSDSINNYEKIKLVIDTSRDGSTKYAYNIIKEFNINSKLTQFSESVCYDKIVWFTFSISNNILTITRNRVTEMTGTMTEGNFVYITKVIGYKK